MYSNGNTEKKLLLFLLLCFPAQGNRCLILFPNRIGSLFCLRFAVIDQCREIDLRTGKKLMIFSGQDKSDLSYPTREDTAFCFC